MIGLPPDQERVAAGRIDVRAIHEVEVQPELGQHLPPPLDGQARRGDDQHPRHALAALQFLEEQPGHDGLARAGVVGQQCAHHGARQQALVDRLELVRQGIDAAGVEARVGIDGVGQAQAVRLHPQPEVLRMAVEGAVREIGGRGAGECGLIVRREDVGARRVALSDVTVATS